MNLQTGTGYLILLLAALGLVRPLASMAGVYEALGGGSWPPVLVTVLVAAVWVGAVAARRASNPIATLAAAGAAYGVLAIILQQVVWNVLGAVSEGAPSSSPVLVLSWISIVSTNTLWGAFLGLVATGLRRLLSREGAEV